MCACRQCLAQSLADLGAHGMRQSHAIHGLVADIAKRGSLIAGANGALIKSLVHVEIAHASHLQRLAQN